MVAMAAVSAATFHPEHYVDILAHGLRQTQHSNPDATVAGLERFIQELCSPPAVRERIRTWDPFVDFVGVHSPKASKAAKKGVAATAALEQSFVVNYVHSSINSMQFERGCFQRFFWILSFMQFLGIESVLFIDSDILVLADLFEAFSISNDLQIFFRLYVNSTYFSVWSVATLSKFCKYIASFYDRPLGRSPDS